MKRYISFGFVIFLVFNLLGCHLINGLDPKQGIDFVSNEGTPVEPGIIATPGTAITEPPPPTRENYAFAGWYEDQDLTILFVFDVMPSESKTLYAKWDGVIITTPDGFILLEKWDGDYGVLGYQGSDNQIAVPSSYDGKAITSIEIDAFAYDRQVTAIVLPDTITTIATRAFYNSSLESLHIPSSVTTLGSRIIGSCNALTHVTFEPGSQLSTIPSFTFAGLYKVNIIIIPKSVTTIESAAFVDSYSLIYVIFENDSQITHIESYAFDTTPNLNHVYLPPSLTTVDYRAFPEPNVTFYIHPSSIPSGWGAEWAHPDSTVFYESYVPYHEIVFDMMGGQPRDSQIFFHVPWFDSNELYTFINDQINQHNVKDGYIFVGWYLDQAYTMPFDISDMDSLKVTVYAKWIPE